MIGGRQLVVDRDAKNADAAEFYLFISVALVAVSLSFSVNLTFSEQTERNTNYDC